MITYEWDHDDLKYVEQKLGAMKKYAPRALRDAVNRTAVAARLRLLRVAQERYTVKAGGFNSRAVIQRASLANPTATMRASSPQGPLRSLWSSSGGSRPGTP